MASFFGLLLVHTCLFHGYMNFMSELMRFADREFYQVGIIISLSVDMNFAFSVHRIGGQAHLFHRIIGNGTWLYMIGCTLTYIPT